MPRFTDEELREIKENWRPPGTLHKLLEDAFVPIVAAYPGYSAVAAVLLLELAASLMLYALAPATLYRVATALRGIDLPLKTGPIEKTADPICVHRGIL